MGLRANLVGGAGTASISAEAAAKASGLANALGILHAAWGWLSCAIFIFFLGRSIEEVAKTRMAIQDDREIEEMRLAAAAAAASAPSALAAASPEPAATSLETEAISGGVGAKMARHREPEATAAATAQ